MYELLRPHTSNFDHVYGVVSETRVSGGKRTQDPHAINELLFDSVNVKPF